MGKYYFIYLSNSFSFDDHLSQPYTALALPQTKQCFYWRKVLIHLSDDIYLYTIKRDQVPSNKMLVQIPENVC